MSRVECRRVWALVRPAKPSPYVLPHRAGYRRAAALAWHAKLACVGTGLATAGIVGGAGLVAPFAPGWVASFTAPGIESPHRIDTPPFRGGDFGKPPVRVPEPAGVWVLGAALAALCAARARATKPATMPVAGPTEALQADRGVGRTISRPELDRPRNAGEWRI